MSTTNCLQSRFPFDRRIVGLFAALAFCATSILISGCKTTSDGKTCCGLGSNDPEKLATVNAPDSDSKTLGQSTDVSDPTTPTPDSKERLDRTFSGVQPEVLQTTPGTENNSSTPSLVANGSSQNSPVSESLDSLDYVTTTNNPTSESNIPDVTPVQSAPIQPLTSNDAQNTNGTSETTSPTPSSGYVSVAPSPNQGSQGEIVDRSAPASTVENSTSEPGETKIDDASSTNNGNLIPEPPVELNSAAVSTFSEEPGESAKSTNQTENSSGVSAPGTSNSTSQPGDAAQPQKQTPDPTLDANVPVTFKPTALSRVIEVQNTGSSEIVNSHTDASQRRARRVASGVSLVPGNSRAKPIDASKDLAHLKRITSR